MIIAQTTPGLGSSFQDYFKIFQLSAIFHQHFHIVNHRIPPVLISSPFSHRVCRPGLGSRVEKGESHRRKIFGMKPRPSKGPSPHVQAGGFMLVTGDSIGIPMDFTNMMKYENFSLDMVM